MGLASEHPPEVYVPYAQFPLQSMDLVLRTDVEPRALVASRAIAAMLFALSPTDPATLASVALLLMSVALVGRLAAGSPRHPGGPGHRAARRVESTRP